MRLQTKDFVSTTVKSIPPSGIRRFFDLASSMENVISLGVGEPDFYTPWSVRETAMYWLERGYTTYTANQGLADLRKGISRYLEELYGVNYDPDEIVITNGVSEGIDLALRATVSPGDEVLIPEPCFVAYKPCVILAGGVPIEVPTRVEDGFKLTSRTLESYITPRSKVLILSYPNNPTGAVMSRTDLEGISKIAERHDLLILSDEIYAELTYEGSHTCFSSINGMRERTVLLSGFSKAFAMTGWRIGFVCAPQPIISAILVIHQYVAMCAPTISQLAAIEALKRRREFVDEMVTEYSRRKNLMTNGLREIGLDVFEPKGAFYIFASIRSTGLSSEEFAEGLLRSERVAVVPGNVFGPSGEGFVRCTYASAPDLLLEALRRIKRFVEGLP